MTFLEAVAHDLTLSNPSVSPSQFKEVMHACRLWQYEWGVIMANANDMHIHVLSTYRKKVFLRKPLREVAFFMFNDYPIITTTVLKNKPDALAFDLRIGWKLQNETATAWHLTMTKAEFLYG
jgi:hypothetical protein